MTLAEMKETLHRFAEERAGAAPERRALLSGDLAETMLYLVRLADRFGVDLIDASEQRLDTEARNQPSLVVSTDSTKTHKKEKS